MLTVYTAKNVTLNNNQYDKLELQHYRTSFDSCNVQTLHIEELQITLILVLVDNLDSLDDQYHLRVKAVRPYSEEVVYSGTVNGDEISTSMSVQNILRDYLLSLTDDFKVVLDQVDFYNFRFNFK
jgi:hypothetical protein